MLDPHDFKEEMGGSIRYPWYHKAGHLRARFRSFDPKNRQQKSNVTPIDTTSSSNRCTRPHCKSRRQRSSKNWSLEMFCGMPPCSTNLSVAKTGRGVSSFRGATRYLFSSVLIWSQIHIFQDLNRCFSAVQSKNTSEAMNSDDLWGFRLWKSAFYNIFFRFQFQQLNFGDGTSDLHLLTCEGLLLAKIMFLCLSSSAASQ